MRAYKLPHPSCIAALVMHSVEHAVRPATVGRLDDAEVTEDCALTAMTATAITTNNLENMEDVFFFNECLLVCERRREVARFLWGS
jgi:hypothetical protein